MPPLLNRPVPLSLLPALLLAGCSHYRLPVNHLETPEARGHSRVLQPARVEVLSLQSGTDLIADPTTRYPEPDENGVVTGTPTQHLQGAYTPAFGFVASGSDRIDLGIRFQPQAPLTFRVKYQFSGEPESRAEAGNISFAGSVAPGILMSSAGGTGMFSVDASLLGGYRFNRRHLVSLSPFFGFATLSGVTSSASSGGSASQFGAGLGYHYTLEALLLRAEIAWASGSLGESQIGGLHFGALIGFSL